MYEMTSDEVLTAVSKQAGCSKINAEKVLQAYREVLIMAVSSGLKVRLHGIGTLTSREMKGGAKFYNPITKQKEIADERPYNIPKFIMSEKLKQKIKEKTLGNTF